MLIFLHWVISHLQVIGSFKAILPIRNPVWGHLTVSTEILVSAGKSCFSFALSMINASAPHQVGFFRHFALLITQQYDSATSSFAIARCSCRSNEYAAVVPFGWPLMLWLIASFSGSDGVIDGNPIDIIIDCCVSLVLLGWWYSSLFSFFRWRFNLINIQPWKFCFYLH